MKLDRSELESKIIIVMTQSRLEQKHSDVRENVADVLAKHNIPKTYTYSLFNGSTLFPSINVDELFLFTSALYEVTKNNLINPEKYFYDEEIRFAKGYIKKSEDISNKIVLYNVDKLSDNQYSCSKMSYYDIYLGLSNGLITYNINTQRDPKKVRFGDTIIDIPNIKDSVSIEIFEKMLNNKFKPNTITFNIRKTGLEKFVYYEKERKLVIEVDNNGSFVDILDGAHRIIAMCKTIEINPKHEGYTLLNIYNDTEEEAQNYIEQESHHTKIDTSYIAAFKNDNVFVRMTKDINVYGTSLLNELFNKLAKQNQDIKIENKYTTIEIFSKSLENNYEIKDSRDIDTTQKWLIRFFNELIGLFKDNDIDLNNMAYNKYMFIGYVALSNKLQHDDDWLNKLNNFINTKILDIDKNFFENLGISKKFKGKITDIMINKISERFKEMI